VGSASYHEYVSRTKVIALSFLGIVVPVALGLTAYLVSRSAIGSAGPIPSLTHAPSQNDSSLTESATPQPSPDRTGQDEQGSNSGSPTDPAPQVTATATDDNGGRCSEPEHSSDPSCGSDDSSGQGSSGGSGGGDDSSNSGHGSGDD
jgi:hypothetical protein